MPRQVSRDFSVSFGSDPPRTERGQFHRLVQYSKEAGGGEAAHFKGSDLYGHYQCVAFGSFGGRPRFSISVRLLRHATSRCLVFENRNPQLVRSDASRRGW